MNKDPDVDIHGLSRMALLTLHVRKERFCEGHIAAMVEAGYIQGILERLKEMREVNSSGA
jgi:hypothetical protein